MKTLNVFYHGLPDEVAVSVGRLAYEKGQGYFEYDSDFLARDLPLSPFLLEQHNQLQQAQRIPFDGIHGVFSDSLPDGWGLYVMDKHLRKCGVNIDELTPLDRLAYIGNRAMGALSYQPDEGEALFHSQGQTVDLGHLAQESIALYIGETQDVLNELAINGTPSGGARPKALLGLKGEQTLYGAYDLPSGFAHWIAKFPTGTTAEHKAEGAIEYLYSRMATATGIDFPETKLVQGSDDNAYFLIKRFDRLANNQRVHMHTLAGLVNADFRVADFSYDNLFRVCRMLTHSQAAVEALFLRMLFNVVMGNRDDHTKNFSFLMNNQGEWRNSPAYDITFNRGIAGEHSMLIGRSGKNISFDDIASLAKANNISPKRLQQLLEQVQNGVDLWHSEANHYPILKVQREEISDYMTVQMKRLRYIEHASKPP